MPKGTKSYLIPVGDMTLTDRKNTRINCDDILMERAIALGIQTDPEKLVIRNALPNTDLGVGIGGPAAGAGTAEDWLIQAAGVLGVELQYFASLLAIDRVMAFYGISVEAAPPSISRVRLTLGAASPQVRGVFQLEELYSRLETAGYFSEAVVFIRNDTIRCMVMPRLAFAVLTERLTLMARIVETIGQVVSTPSG